jgi:hypothetical protein
MDKQTVGKGGATGLDDVSRSLRELVGTTRSLAEDASSVLERELAAAIRISEGLRDDVVSGAALKEAREGRLTRKLRDDSHRFVDLVADVGGVAGQSALRLVRRFAEEPRIDRAG